MDETQNDAPFVAFYDMHAVTFVPPDEMADVTIARLQWFILIPPIKPHGVYNGKETSRKFMLKISCIISSNQIVKRAGNFQNNIPLKRIQF